tara:strand:- start:336 stop:500 length:165 start_codon:yes stop_codon:yes gene_type:complete
MNEVLTIAYDLKHQVECLPDALSHCSKVDKYNTDLTMLERIETIIKALERGNNG